MRDHCDDMPEDLDDLLARFPVEAESFHGRALVLEVDDYEFVIDTADLWKPARVTVRRGAAEAQFWIDEDAGLAGLRRAIPQEIERMQALVREHHDDLFGSWVELKNDARRGRLEKRHVWVD